MIFKKEKNYKIDKFQGSHDSRNRDYDKVILNMCKQHTKGKLLDIASGTGYLSKKLCEMGYDVISADINPILERERERERRKEFHEREFKLY
ncbi:hypothetical protein MBCUT_08480 [Methanobrevibacter cuticularis]|uniref:Methyltransferase domain-containing protein n=1 Tax=Methanobrevibacter cuticularis TaxID=47311 RepID=A0A166EAZ8_9EURY|nr:SAM-dependent methyltransferase [Methanobrevibacter cuticularis]KZX16462.1 hypothetical protein MBCUT_08480 [Methanobrevibacter cuticularis]